MEGHRRAEARSLAYHRLIAERLRSGEVSLERARQRIRSWLADGATAEHYARAWRRALDAPLSEVCALLESESEEAAALRQVSPFAGYLGARERWQVWANATRSES
jgi:hypothetical protein